MSVAYDADGRRSTLTEPGGGVLTYSFDSASRLTGTQNPQGERTTWAYDSLSRVSTLTYANTATVTGDRGQSPFRPEAPKPRGASSPNG